MDSGVPAIETMDLGKTYGRHVALDGLTLTVGRGEILGFVGPNGAGKTTTIRILVGLVRPTRGTARVAGVDCVRDARALKRLVGYMPDLFGSYANMRVSEYLDFFGAAFGLPRRDRARRVTEVLELAGGAGFDDLFVEALSHGMKQRVALARTLLHDPEVLILDEPANGLDPPARIEMRRLLLELAARGKTLLVSSHVLPELARVAHRVAILSRGRLRACGTLAEIARQLRPLRALEVLLTGPERVAEAAELVRRHVEPGAEVSASPAEAAVRFRTARREDEIVALLAALVTAGLGVVQFREVQTDLEEAFTIASRDATDEHAADGHAADGHAADGHAPGETAGNGITAAPGKRRAP